MSVLHNNSLSKTYILFYLNSFLAHAARL